MTGLSNYLHFRDVSLDFLAEADIGATVALINDAYSYQDEAKGRPRINAQELRQKLDSSEFYVGKQDGRVIACLYVQRLSRRLHFGLLTVSRELRGKGLGSALMEAIEDYARASNINAIELDYMSTAPWLKRYYGKYGWVETGEVTPWGTINLIRMVKKV